ncbi:hypothetical protein [Streptomyces sp. N35]|uniref:hypothetical protein n=1 Tax=Streptomyces sp. N35 TaxID=2795730 RepID=UPI0018F45D6D|nr:hypothetical protein [Streptomyces sp. N35]
MSDDRPQEPHQDNAACERLMAEGIPTGTFGNARPPQPAARRPAPPARPRTAARAAVSDSTGQTARPIRPWTPEEQAAHYAELMAGLYPARRSKSAEAPQPSEPAEPHLRLIHTRAS